MATTQGSPSSVVTLSEAETSSLSAFSVLSAMAVALIILYFIAQTRVGEVIIYDALLLLIVLILVRNYRSVVSLLAPISGVIPSGAAPSGTTPPGFGGSSSGIVTS